MFYKKHEKIQSKHNGKNPIKLGSKLLPTEKKENSLKKDLGTFSLPLLWNQW